MAGEAVLEITIDSNNIQISNFGNNSFQIKNTGDKTIAKVEIDVTNALYSDAVFDPFGKAGDTVSKPLTINSNGGTGIVAPSNASYIGAGGQAGFKGIQLVFDENNNNGFEPGETVGFSIDMDPNSVTGTKKQPLDAGSNPSWDVGGVSGAELIGSSFKVTFTDGTTATGQLQGADNQAGAQALASQDSPDLSATLKVNGLDAGDIGTYDENPSVIVNGPAGETARVVLTKGFIQPVTPYAQFLQNQLDVLAGSDFPANNAVEFQTVDVKLTGEDQDISNFFNFSGVAKFNFQGEDQLPLGFVASIIDPSNNDLSIGSVTKPIYLEFQEQNSEPNPNPKPELQNRVYGVKDGQVIIEAENTNLQGNWENIEIDGRQGVLYDGKNSFGKVPVGQTLEYNFQTDEEGNYYIALHSARHEAAMQKFANDLGNDAWVEVIDSQTNETILNPTKLFTHFGSVNEEYKWGTTFDINHEKSAATVNLSANKEYTLRISGRSDGYVLDRITLSNDGFLKNISTPESPLLEESPSQPTNDPVLPPENPSDQPNPDSSVIRINAGGDAYTDQEGNLWSADQFFVSGNTFQTTSSIAKTTDDPLYQTERWQKNLSYNIPVENGDYQVTLKFAEIYWNKSGLRVFDAFAEGKNILDNLDLFSDAGGKNVAFDQTFTINVDDGNLDLDFVSNLDNAKIAAIEILPTSDSNPNPNPEPEPNPDSSVIRINAGGDAYTDQEGNLWSADQFFVSGNTFQTTSSIAKTTDDPLYQTERWQKNLSYNIPVENGDYQVTLKFAEIYWNKSRLRVFDAFAEGKNILDNLDLFSDAGGKNVAFDQTFTINVDDGNLDLDFVSNLDNAKIAAIEILPLDVFTEPRGAIVGVDFIDKKVTVALPDDASIGNDPTAVDIFPWRAPASGGNLFTIGGHNFDDLTNTSVTIGGEVANITSVSDGLIQGTLPNIDNAGGLVDVVVESGGFTTLLEDAFLPLI